MTGIVNDLSIFVSFAVGLESPTYSLFQGDEVCHRALIARSCFHPSPAFVMLAPLRIQLLPLPQGARKNLTS